MAGCALQPGAVVALFGSLEPVHDNRLHRSAPHPDRGRKFSEQGGRRIEAKPEADSRGPNSRPQQERRSLDRTPAATTVRARTCTGMLWAPLRNVASTPRTSPLWMMR